MQGSLQYKCFKFGEFPDYKGQIPKFSELPSVKTTGWIQKSWGKVQNGTYILYLHAEFDGDLQLGDVRLTGVYLSILMQFSAFFIGGNVPSTHMQNVELCHRWRHKRFKIRSKFLNFRKIWRTVWCTQLRHFIIRIEMKCAEHISALSL